MITLPAALYAAMLVPALVMPKYAVQPQSMMINRLECCSGASANEGLLINPVDVGIPSLCTLGMSPDNPACKAAVESVCKLGCERNSDGTGWEEVGVNPTGLVLHSDTRDAPEVKAHAAPPFK